MSTPEASTALPRRQAVLLLAALWFAYFLNYSDRQAVFAMFPVLKTGLGFTDTQLGLTGSIFLWVYGLSCPIAGQIADNYSKRRLVVLSLVLWSGVTVATGFATSAFMLLGLRAAMGLSESLYMPAAIALAANAHPPGMRSRAVAGLTTAQIAGTVGGAWFGGWMADRGWWRGAFFVLGAVGLLYALPYGRFLRGVDEAAPVQTKRAGLAVGTLARVRTFLGLCVVFPAFVFGLWLLYGWLPNLFHEKFALTLSDAAFNATAFLQGATLLGMLGGGVLADRLGRHTKAARFLLLMASLLLCAPCLHALAASGTLNEARLAALGFGLFSGLFMGNIFPAAFEVVPADTRASAVGVLNFFGALVSGFATLAGGLWRKSPGIERLLDDTALLYVGGALLLLAAVRFFFPRDFERIQ